MKVYFQMKDKALIFAFLILFSCSNHEHDTVQLPNSATNDQQLKFVHTGCAFMSLHDEPLDLLKLNDSIVIQELENLMKLEGLKEGFFKIASTKNIKFAKASSVKSSTSNIPKRYIVYSDYLVDRCKNILGQDWIWGLRLILAHEIAHHKFDDSFRIIIRDSISAELNHKIELDADRYAGSMLALLGATLEQSIKLFTNLEQKSESYTHPNFKDRANAIREGWEKGRKSIACFPNSLGKYKISDYPGGVNLTFRNRVLTDEEIRKINTGNIDFRLEIDKDSRIGFLNSGKEVYLLGESGKHFNISTFIGQNRVDGFIIKNYEGKPTIEKLQ